MQQPVLDIENPALPNTWAHRNPVKAGLLMALLLILLQLALTYTLYPLQKQTSTEQVASTIRPELKLVLIWGAIMVLIATILLPSTATQYFYRTSLASAKYFQVFKRGLFTGILGTAPAFLLFDILMSRTHYRNFDDFYPAVPPVVFLAFIVTLILNLVLAIFFKKTQLLS